MDIIIADNLKKARKGLNYTPEYVVDELAKIGMNISVKTLYGYESGSRQPKADMFVALCKIYNIPSLRLFCSEYDINAIPAPGEGGELAADAAELVADYGKLNPTGRRKARDYTHDLTENPKYTTAEPSIIGELTSEISRDLAKMRTNTK